jgi:hypothetical protein
MYNNLLMNNENQKRSGSRLETIVLLFDSSFKRHRKLRRNGATNSTSFREKLWPDTPEEFGFESPCKCNTMNFVCVLVTSEFEIYGDQV